MEYSEHCFIPDTQNRRGTKVDHLIAAGNYLTEKRPQKIILGGDWWDFPSLSAWESAATKARAKRVYLEDFSSEEKTEGDIEAGNNALDAFMEPIVKIRSYKPETHFLTGNHEHRIERFKTEHPYLGGAISMAHTNLEKYGIISHPFLKPVILDGIHYAHYFCRNSRGTVTNSKNGQNSAMAQVKNEGVSCTAGHRQGLDTHIQESRGGRKRGIIAGSFYQHKEQYMANGNQGQNHWHGILYKHEVYRGDYDLMEVSLRYLLDKYL